MKKSFLKRVAAAVVAVPVALTQTALFTSFAVDETTTQSNTNKKVSLETLMKVDADATLQPAADFSKYSATKLEKFTAAELTKANAYVQFSDWGNELKYVGLPAFVGTYELDKSKLAKGLDDRNGTKFNFVKKAINDKNTKATAVVTSNKIEITIDFDYTYDQDLADMATEAMNKKIAQKYDDVTVEVKPAALKGNNLFGKIVLTADLSKAASKKLVFNATVVGNGTELKGADAVEKFFDGEAVKALNDLQADAEAAVQEAIAKNQKTLDEAKEKLAKAESDLADAKKKGATGTEVDEAEAKVAKAKKDADAAQKALDDANATAHENLVQYANNLLKKVKDYEGKVDGKKNAGERPFEVRNAANMDAVLAEADQTFRKAPASVSRLESSRFFGLARGIFDGAVDNINSQAKNGAEFAINSTALMDVIKAASNISAFADVNAKDGVYTTKGETLFYVKDDVTEAEKTKIISQLNDKVELVKNKVEVDPATLVTVKVVEAKGALDASTAFTGDATVDIYRIVYFDTKEIKETTPTETTPTETKPTETTPTETTPTETTPTETTPTETTPTETTPTETKPTETTPTETKPTETTPTETKPTETTTTTKHTKVAGEIEMNVTVKTELVAGAGFYYDNDANTFNAGEMAELPSESPEMEGAVAVDKFTVGDAAKNLTPADLYAANSADDKYVVKALQLYYNGLKVVDKDRKDVTVTVYVGVKGDINQDGACNAFDANSALIHAAAVGTTKDGEALPTITDLGKVKKPAIADQATFDKFLIFLGDVDTESVKGELPKEKIAVNAKDANAMLRYAAQVGTNKKPGEEGHKTTSELWTIVLGENNLPTYSKAIAAFEALKKLA